MADKKNDGFFHNVNKFFKRVGSQNQDLISLGGGNKINVFNSPQSREERRERQELQVFRQFLQNKNWNLKHIEFFDEYRRMDATFPIINAAIRLYSQEVCIVGASIISTPQGDITIEEQYKKNSNYFLVKSYNLTTGAIQYNECKGVVNNGVRDVYEVEVVRNIDEETSKLDNKEKATFKCTDNHKILLPDKTFKELKQLQVGDQIMGHYLYTDPSCSCKENRLVTTTIISIKHVGQEEVYDLVNVSPYHNFSIKLTDTFSVFVHNCNKDADGNIFKVVSDDKSVKHSLHECYIDNLKLDTRSYLYVRSMLKFGNLFGKLQTRRGVGVTDLIQLPPEAIRIMLEPNADRLDQFKYNWFGHGGGLEFDPWEIVHWKIIEDIEHEPYGQSILRSIVDTWRRIVLMRESLVIYRVTRAPQRFLFKIDTTGLDPDAAIRHADEMKKSLHKKPLINPMTGEMDAKFTSASILEDFYMPTYEGDNSDISVLEGASNLGDVEDYKIIKDDLFAGLLIPKSYLCFVGETKVKSLDGNDYTILELEEKYKKGENIFVYASDENGDIVPGEVEWVGSTREETITYTIELDNGETAECSNDHLWRMRDGSYRRADELVEGDSLMPLYTKISNESERIKGYEMVWHNGKQKWEHTHRMVAKWRNPDCYKQDGNGKKVIHHLDINKLNNHPNNLLECTQKEHIELHKEIAYKNLCSKESRKKTKITQNSKVYRKKLSQIRKDYFKNNKDASNPISETNKKLGKTKIMLKTHAEKIKNKEISQFGKFNGNFKGMISKEEAFKVLENTKFKTFNQLRKFIKDNYPDVKANFHLLEFAQVCEMTPSTLFDLYGFSFNQYKKYIVDIDEEKVIELVNNGLTIKEILKELKLSSEKFNLYYLNKYNQDFFNYQEKQLDNFYFSKKAIPHNHKIVSIRVNKYNTPKKLYDLTIKKYHNFALTAGVFVHNSFEEDLSNKAALCLRSNTNLLTTEGKISIKDLSDLFDSNKTKKIYVLSCNEFGLTTQGKVVWCKPTKLVDKLYRVHLSNGRYHDTTDNHPFLLDNMVYRRADELVEGDLIKNIYDKEITVSKIEIIDLDEPEYVYDLEVEKYHNFALDSGIFVHNSQEDLRFNNAVKQYQSYYIEGLLQIGLVHLYMNGYSKDELESFSIEMNGSSTLAEKAKNELLQQRIELAHSALDDSYGMSIMSYTQTLKEILKFTDEEIAQTFKDQLIEKKLMWRLNQIKESGFYEEPNPDKKKAKMRGLDTDVDVFKELQFESDQKSRIDSIITKKVEEEIKHLTKPVRKNATKKMIDSVISLNESKISKNIKKTYTDLGIKDAD